MCTGLNTAAESTPTITDCPITSQGERSMSVCLSVCLSVCVRTESGEPHVRTSPGSLCTLPVAVARSSSGGVAISYVLPVLWMTSCFLIMGPIRRRDATVAASWQCRARANMPVYGENSVGLSKTQGVATSCLGGCVFYVWS